MAIQRTEPKPKRELDDDGDPLPEGVVRIKPGSMAARLWPDKKYFKIEFEGDAERGR
jgi:hypothetical protein